MRGGILIVAIIIIAFVGELLCLIKAIRCNWDPVGKAEVVYTASFLTGFGAIVGWFDIQDK